MGILDFKSSVFFKCIFIFENFILCTFDLIHSR